jgi:protein TonB
MKTTTIEYGFPELRTLYKNYISTGLVTAGLIHVLFLSGYQLYFAYSKERFEFPPQIRRNIGFVLPVPPPIGNSSSMPNVSVAVSQSVQKGIPIPVPDASISTEMTIPDQHQMNAQTESNAPGTDNGTSTIIDEGTVLDDEAPPPPFVPIEKQPVIVTQITPLYPEIPKRAGVEGTVIVKMWVTKEGKVKAAEVIKSSSELFNQAAIAAALQWTFTPAIMNDGPVAVWVTVPFTFRLTAAR